MDQPRPYQDVVDDVTTAAAAVAAAVRLLTAPTPTLSEGISRLLVDARLALEEADALLTTAVEDLA